MRWWRKSEREQDLERELRSDLEAAEQPQNCPHSSILPHSQRLPACRRYLRLLGCMVLCLNQCRSEGKKSEFASHLGPRPER